MWRSVLLEDNNKWSTTPSTATFKANNASSSADSDDVYDNWTVSNSPSQPSSSSSVVVQQTNYVDWNGQRDQDDDYDDDDDTVDFFQLHHHHNGRHRRSSVDGSDVSAADELFRNFVGKLLLNCFIISSFIL